MREGADLNLHLPRLLGGDRLKDLLGRFGGRGCGVVLSMLLSRSGRDLEKRTRERIFILGKEVL